MWKCGKCNKAMWTDPGSHRSIQTGSGEAEVAGLCRLCARDHDAQDAWQVWKTACGFLVIAALTGYMCYSFFLNA